MAGTLTFGKTARLIRCGSLEQNPSMMHRQKRKRPRAGLVAGSLLTTNYQLDGTLVHRGYGSRTPINDLIKRPSANGSNQSAATTAMLACGDLRNKQRGLGNVSTGRYIFDMAKHKRETEWEVIRLKATPLHSSDWSGRPTKRAR